jgi:hypothetical protein
MLRNPNTEPTTMEFRILSSIFELERSTIKKKNPAERASVNTFIKE